MRHLFPLVVSYNRFVELEKESVAGKMHRHQFRGQHSSEGMQESKDTCP